MLWQHIRLRVIFYWLCDGHGVHPWHSLHHGDCRSCVDSAVGRSGVGCGIRLPGFLWVCVMRSVLVRQCCIHVPDVGEVYVRSCGIGSGRFICGFVLKGQIGLVWVDLLHHASGYWGVFCLYLAARGAFAISYARSHVQVGSPRQATAALRLGVFIVIAFVVSDSSSLSGRQRWVIVRAVAFSVVPSVSSSRRHRGPIPGPPPGQ